MITVILTGGKSRRMGRDKALLPLDGTVLRLALAKKFKTLGPVYFSVDRAGRFPESDYPELPDPYPGQGPLNGLIAAFRQTDAERVLLMATDMPECTVAAAEELMQNLGTHDACLFEGEPLFGLYTRKCLTPAEKLMQQGSVAMRDLLARVDVLYLKNSDSSLFLNLNTPEEYASYLQTRKNT